MKIAVLGTGIVGQTIALKLKSLGHDVMIGTRDVAKTLARTDKDGYGNPPFSEWYKQRSDIQLGNYKEAATHAELLFNCTAGTGAVAALWQAGEANLKGKILVDIANPLDFSQGMPPSLNPVNTDSLGETIQRTFPELKVVKTLNTMNCYLMVNPSLVPGDHNVFISGNDADAKTKAIQILKSFDWKENNVIDLGDISTARGTEQLLPIWIRLWGKLQTAMFNFHIVQAK
ncbi:MAG: NAD(P)-binding domain-containing protein [Bacteroidetes bacterium]|nr:NAD(P)-binding domain-containing protein [Bacteroidota bacterium]